MRPAQPCANKLCNQIALKNPLLLYPHPPLLKLMSSLDIPPLPILILEKFSDFLRKCYLELWRVTMSVRCIYSTSHTHMGGYHTHTVFGSTHFMLLDFDFFYDCANSTEPMRAFSDTIAWKIKKRGCQ